MSAGSSVPRNRASFQDLANSELLRLLSARPTGSTAPWLPMPVPEDTLRHLGGVEWILFNKLQALQAGDFPEYGTAFWNRPTPQTAHAVWDQFHQAFGLKLSDLSQPWHESWEPTQEERAAHDTTIMQAFTLIMATAVWLGDAHQLLTQNRVLEALCQAWSDHWRQAVESGRAGSIFHLTPENWRKCRRDLVRHRLDLSTLWALLSPGSLRSGDNPLFWLEGVEESEVAEGDEESLPGGSYQVKLRAGTEDLRVFKNLIRADRSRPAPHYVNPYGRYPILRSRPSPGRLRMPRREIIAETAFDICTSGSVTHRVCDALERATTLLDVDAFRTDFLNAEGP